MASKVQIDLAQLADSYDIVGALSGRDDAQVALATRKSDGLPVLITAVVEPKGDSGNALSHLASDAKILSSSPHPALLPVLEGRWVGNDAFAIVTPRVADTSLEDRLSRREEEFSFPRIAAILRQLNGLLEWARERRVVHRALRPDVVFVHDGSDAVQAMFTVSPLAANGIPDETDDARTIASLARAMLTRSVADPARDALPLAELRPGLPSRVIQQTEALTGRADSLEPIDVRAYISAIAMAEELKHGEEEFARVKQEMFEEQRQLREQLAAERKAHEEDLAEQARKFAKEREATLKAMAKEREDAARALAKEREESERALAREREEGETQLRQERERFEKEMERQRKLLARERTKLERERAAFDREREKQRALIAERLAALQAQAQLAGAAAMPVALTEPLPEPEPYVPVDDMEPLDEPLEEPIAETAERPMVTGLSSSAHRARGTPWYARFRSDRRFKVGGVAALALLLIGAIAFAIGRRGESTAQSAVVSAPVSTTPVVDSLAGVTVPYDPFLDSSQVRPDSQVVERPRPARRRAEAAPRPERQDTTPQVADPFAAAPPGSALPFTRDSASPTDTARRPAPRDTTVRRDSVVPPRRDTTRPDSLRAGS